MRPWEVDAALRALVRRGTRQGLLGGNRPWLVIGGLAFAVRRLRRRANGVVWSEEITPGQMVTVEHFGRGGAGRRPGAPGGSGGLPGVPAGGLGPPDPQ